MFAPHPPRCSERGGGSGGNRSDGGKKEEKRAGGVISALKIVSLPGFLSPGNSSHGESVRTWFSPTPSINDLPTALTGSFFNAAVRPASRTMASFHPLLLINGAYSALHARAQIVKDNAPRLMEDSEIPS